MRLRSGLLGIITLLAATGGVFTANFPAPFSVLPVMAQDATEQKAEAERLLDQGIKQLEDEQFQEASQSFQQVLEIYRELGDRSQEAEITLEIGVSYSEVEQNTPALEYFQKALAIYRELGEREIEAEILKDIVGVFYFELGQPSKGLEYFQKALAIYRELGDQKAEVRTLTNIGRSYVELERYSQGLEYFQQVLEIYRELGDSYQEGNTLHRIGDVYGSLEQYPQALEHYQQALAIAREIDFPFGEALTLKSIGDVYESIKQYSQALQYYQQALQHYLPALVITREDGDRAAEGRILNAISDIYRAIGENHRIQARYPQAIESYQEGSTLHRIGEEYESLEQYTQALEHYQQALAIAREIDFPIVEALTLQSIGDVYGAIEQYPQALQYYQQALLITREIRDRDVERRILSSIGNIYRIQAQYSQAIESYQEALRIEEQQRRVGNSRGWGWGRKLRRLAEIYIKIHSEPNRYADAIAVFEEMLSGFRSNGEREPEAELLIAIANEYLAQREHPRAVEFYQQALAVTRASGDREEELKLLRRLGKIYRQQKQYSKALEAYQKALIVGQAISGNLRDRSYDIKVIEGRRWGRSSPDVEVETLIDLSATYHLFGDYQAENEYYQKALAVSRHISGREGEFVTTYRLASVYGNSWNMYPKAIELYQQALTLARPLDDSKAEIFSLLELGNIHLLAGPYQKAVESYREALTIYESTDRMSRRGIDSKGILNEIGIAYHRLGRYADAIQAYNQVLNTRWGESHKVAVTNNLGASYRALGQYQKALELHNQVLRLAPDSDWGEPEFEKADALNNLGMTYQALEEYQKAIAFHQQALKIFQVDEDNRNEAASTLNNLGTAYQALGQYQNSLVSHQQALEIFREIGNRGGEASALNNLGEVYRSLGEYDKAVEFYQQALTVFQYVGDREKQGIILSNMGRLLVEQNQPELAIVFFKQSVNIRETIRRDIQGLPQEQQQSYTETVAKDYRRLADLLLKQDRILEAQRVLDLLKVQELDDYLRGVRGNAITASGVEFWQPELEILERYNAQQKTAITLGQELTKLRRIPEENRTTAQQQRIDELVQLEKELNKNFNNFIENEEIIALIEQLSRRVQRQNLNLEDISALRDNLKKLDAVLLYPLILEDRIELVITTPDSPPLRRTVEGVGREQLNEVILAFRQALQSPTSDALTPAQQLYQWLIEPLENDLSQANPQTIIYAPDGQLRYIPLTALHDGKQWLAQRYQVNNITARSLTELDTQPQSQPRVLAGAFADATITHPVQIGQQQATMSGLPFAGREVETLVANLPDSISYFDQDFSLKAIESRLNEHNIIHFATHAAFVPGKPEDSFILFGNGDQPTLADIKDWSLQNVDLVVLSACETGLGGQLGNGEEILGLGYQFQRAGARATIASLWQVDDGGTQMLMNAFYNVLQGGNITKAEALRQAQLALITDDYSILGEGESRAVAKLRDGMSAEVVSRLGHPYYWAPFILIGNGL
ncbi:MAG: tetratricopeptide repeat protein [Coleofasciculaceae cyanobacterium]